MMGKIILYAIVLISSCMMLVGCGNDRRESTDMFVRVALHEEDLQHWAQRVDLTYQPFSLLHDLRIDIGDLDISGSDGGTAIVVCIVAGLLVCDFTYSSVEYLTRRLDTTEVTIEFPDLPTYRQVLYWGDTTVWLPQEWRGTVQPALIKVRGFYCAQVPVLLEVPSDSNELMPFHLYRTTSGRQHNHQARQEMGVF